MYRLKLDCINKNRYYAVDRTGDMIDDIATETKIAEGLKSLLETGVNDSGIKIIRSVYETDTRMLRIEVDYDKNRA